MNLLGDRFGDGQSLQVHKLTQFTQLIYIPGEQKFNIKYINNVEQRCCKNLLDLPSKLDTDDGLEEVVDDFDEVGGVDDETGLQVLSVPEHEKIVKNRSYGQKVEERNYLLSRTL